MSILTIELPQHQTQTALNLRRWAEVSDDSELARFEGRVETDRHGHTVMSPPPAPNHGSLQAAVASLLDRHMKTGRVLTECPISTADGVKAADVAWASPDCMRDLGSRLCFPKSPEICVEVLSPSNSDAEIQEKMARYFDAGAQEVWCCGEFGAMSFFGPEIAAPMRASRLCPRFPKEIKLR